MFEVYASSEMGLFVVFVARKRAVSLWLVSWYIEGQDIKDVHDVLRMPVHHGVFKVEALQIADCSRFYLLGKPKHATNLSDFAQVKLDKNLLVVCAEKGHASR